MSMVLRFRPQRLVYKRTGVVTKLHVDGHLSIRFDDDGEEVKIRGELYEKIVVCAGEQPTNHGKMISNVEAPLW